MLSLGLFVLPCTMARRLNTSFSTASFSVAFVLFVDVSCFRETERQSVRAVHSYARRGVPFCRVVSHQVCCQRQGDGRSPLRYSATLISIAHCPAAPGLRTTL